MVASDRQVAAVTVDGEEGVTLRDATAALERFPWTTRAFSIHCHSGRVLEGRWAGVPVPSLLAAARVPPETTHLLVTGRDGHRACVDVAAAGEALLAFECETVELASGDGPEPDCDGSSIPRFLADVESPRTVRAVERIEPVTVSRGEDPAALETI